MNMGRWIALGALAIATPLAAQDAAPPSAEAVPAEATADTADAERLAMAERVIERIWPVGTMRRMMESQLASSMDAATAFMGELPEDDTDSKEARRAAHEARTGRPVQRPPSDPVPQELSQLTNAALAVIERMEPAVRTTLVRVYARRYSLVQLTELDAFFATPTGAAYAAEALTIMEDPEIRSAMNRIAAEMATALVENIVADAADAVSAEMSSNRWKVE